MPLLEKDIFEIFTVCDIAGTIAWSLKFHTKGHSKDVSIGINSSLGVGETLFHLIKTVDIDHLAINS